MAQLVLGPLLRYVSATAATVWVETDQPCDVEVLGVRTRTFTYELHSYALVVIEHLQPGSVLPYDVRLDGNVVWPPPDTDRPATIRTLVTDDVVSVKFGSCRSAAPHVEPEILEPDDHAAGKGVDALRATGLVMLQQPHELWPDVIMFLGDQVYADESEDLPARHFARVRRPNSELPPPGIVTDFEEYTALYRDAWGPEIERWVLSVTPTTMIFDDHEVIDDWNISEGWLDDIRKKRWWSDHIIGGMVSYWIYQHLGNLSPERIAHEGMLDEIVRLGDATDYLRRWALKSEEFTPVRGGYQFSYDRHLSDAHAVVIDVRNGRVLKSGEREIVDEDEWEWIRDRALEPSTHLILATSLPAFAPGGLHGLQQWNEALADGDRGRFLRRPSEALRRALDLEHWAAFDRSFRRLESLLIEVATPTPDHTPPRTVTIISGDIHFAFVVDVNMPPECTSIVRQAICSPLRNTLGRRERLVMKLGVSRIGRRLGQRLLLAARRSTSQLSWELSSEPIFQNNIGTLEFDGDNGTLRIETARMVEGEQVLREEVVVSLP